MNVEAENAVMRERAKIRERVLTIEGEEVLIVGPAGTQSDVLIKRSEVLKLLQ